MQLARGETGMGCNSNSKIKSRYLTAIEPSRHRVKEKSGKRRQAVKRTSSRGHQTAHLLSSREHIEYGLGGWIDTLMDYWKDAKMEGRRCEWKEDWIFELLMNRQKEEWMEGRIDFGWIDGWMVVCLDAFFTVCKQKHKSEWCMRWTVASTSASAPMQEAATEQKNVFSICQSGLGCPEFQSAANDGFPSDCWVCFVQRNQQHHQRQRWQKQQHTRMYSNSASAPGCTEFQYATGVGIWSNHWAYFRQNHLQKRQLQRHHAMVYSNPLSRAVLHQVPIRCQILVVIRLLSLIWIVVSTTALVPSLAVVTACKDVLRSSSLRRIAPSSNPPAITGSNPTFEPA